LEIDPRKRFVADSPLEGDGFELPVPREKKFQYPIGWGDIFPLNETLPDGVLRGKVGWREQAPPDSPTFKAAY
jgi:hypothetical protein